MRAVARMVESSSAGLVSSIVSFARTLAGAAALGLVVGSASFLISSEGWWNWLLDSSRESSVAGMVVREHRSVAEGVGGEGAVRVLPDRRLTPGATVAIDISDMCKMGYAASVRDVGPELRSEVFREYGLFWGHRRDYEIDHLVPLSLGGQNSIQNLWPESRVTHPWNARVKDLLEDVLHREVCAGRVSLEEAQEAIRTDWVAAYRKYIGLEPRSFVPRSAGGWGGWQH
jgi:hypothetical protein